MKIGTVKSLWRYPTKSLLGESLKTVKVDFRGIEGDRLYVISNAQGKFGSTKNTRRFRRIDGLFAMSSHTHLDDVYIEFPNGEVVSSSDKTIDDKLSAQLELNVSLTKEKSIPHFDDGAIHIISTSELAKLQSKLPKSLIDECRFRANIVIDCDLYDENLIGKVLKIGNVELKVLKKTERCRMVSMAQGNLNDDPKILREIAQSYNLNFGVYASVVTKGLIGAADTVAVI